MDFWRRIFEGSIQIDYIGKKPVPCRNKIIVNLLEKILQDQNLLKKFKDKNCEKN